MQILGFIDGCAVATARVRILQDHEKNIAKIERVAISRLFRNKGLCKQLMSFIIQHLISMELDGIVLESQTHACSFYEGLGFSRIGNEFLDANIPHYKMTFSAT